MNWLQKISNDLLDDLFFNTPTRKETKKDPPTVVPTVLKLYRGFDADINKLQKTDNGYILSPHKCEQGGLWFTHQLISGYDPIEYVTGRGKYLLTFPLQCKRHVQRTYYDDGSTYEGVPDEIYEKEQRTEDCPFYAGYELPPGWFFSYKMEKFIICKIPITITPDMISEQK